MEIFGGYITDREKSYEISVIVCSYNPKIEAMIYTLDSIVEQDNVDLEIIIADDGSENNLSEKVEEYFKKKNFNHWKMVCNEINKGTVYNMYSGIKASSGKYIKSISPGDALNGKDILRRWIDFNITNGYRWSFSDAIYYIGNPSDKNVVSVQAHPNKIRPYIHKDKKRCRWNYVVFDDIALGAAILCERELQLEYSEKILDKVIYAEDNIWRMMMFEGIVGGYYPYNAILYEYGTGVSTNGSDVWGQRLRKDWDAANEIMINRENFDAFQQNIIKAWSKKDGNIFQKLCVKGKIKDYIERKISRRKTSDCF